MFFIGTIVLMGAFALTGHIVLAVICGGIVGLITLNIRILEDSPRTVGVISFLGKRTPYTQEGLVFLLKPIVDVIEFPIKIEEKPYELKSVQCKVGAIEGKFEVGIKPDASSGTTLGEFDDAGRYDGALKLIDDAIRAALQETVADRTVDEVVRRQHQLQGDVLAKACGRIRGDSNETNDLRGLGFVITKFNLSLIKDKKTIEAEQKALSADALASRVLARIAAIKKMNEGVEPSKQQPIPSFEQARKDILEEQRTDDGLIQEFRGAPKDRLVIAGGGIGK